MLLCAWLKAWVCGGDAGNFALSWTAFIFVLISTHALAGAAALAFYATQVWSAIYLLVLTGIFLALGCRSLVARKGDHAITRFGNKLNPELSAPLHPAADDGAGRAVTNDRRRIARELHDGVGSQLTTLLSSLDCKNPHQRAVALALEQCLIDLKMTVDAIDSDSDSDSLPDSLGRLRYRVQHCLDRLGVSMEWHVAVCPALEAFCGDGARHALRITQESLANVIRHAHATKVRVSCKFVPSVNRVVLEVFDNGKGMALEHVPPSGGRGLQGMRQRALDAGGSLQISSQLGSGTLVQLTLEFTPAKLHNLSADRPANTGVFRPAVF